MTERVSFFTMDVGHDLAYGEHFWCIERGEYYSRLRTLPLLKILMPRSLHLYRASLYLLLENF